MNRSRRLAGRILMAVFVLLFAGLLGHGVSAFTTTGTYVGDGGPSRTITTGLTSIKALYIVSLPARGPSASAYTSVAIQGIAPGTFINGSKRDSGLALNAGDFVVSSPDFNEPGVTYGWEVNGD